MYETSFFPLRTIIGNSVQIAGKTPQVSIDVIAESPTSKRLRVEYVAELKGSLGATTTNPRYLSYLPELVIEGEDIGLGLGMNYLPVPPLPPFDPSASMVSLFALSKEAKREEISRQLSVTFRISLAKPALVGGICYAGYPYLPYCITHVGENSSNFGLPREARLICYGTSSDEARDHQNQQFLDIESAVTYQNIISHSGFHFLCTDPTYTDNLTLRLSDFPTILTRHIISKGKDDLEHDFVERYGFIIPYFYIFEYQERTRYRPIVRGGLLGAHLNHDGDEDRAHEKESCSHAIEYTHITPDPARRYHDFTAASVFGQQRQYAISERGERRVLEECFISDPVPSRSNVTLYLQQSEVYERCIAGIKLQLPFIPEKDFRSDPRIDKLFPRGLRTEIELLAEMPRDQLKLYINEEFQIPIDVKICEKIGIRVYELDPLDGMSPMMVPLDGEYSTLLADLKVDEFTESLLTWMAEGIQFVRPSHAKYFAVELTNFDEDPAQFVVKRLDLIQSAHVSIHPKASRTQQVRVLNFRLVGENLADDYAKLGDHGFNFSIERLVAGERKGILFKVNSLLDLLHSGVAKIYTNTRRRAVEFEQVRYNSEINNNPALGQGRKNYDIRTSEAATDGWRRSETGSNSNVPQEVVGKARWRRNLDNWPERQQNPYAPSEQGEVFGFSTLGSREVRTHSENLGPELHNEWRAINDYLNILSSISSLGTVNEILPHSRRLDDNGWATRAWIGSIAPKVQGLTSVTANPLMHLIDLMKLIRDIHTGIINPATVTAALGGLLFGNLPILLSGGGNSSISVGLPGAGINIGIQPVPSLNYVSTVGSSGQISRTASEDHYMYSQLLIKSFEDSRLVVYTDEGNQSRILTRKPVPDTDNQRIKGAEVMWQGALVDIITGSIPLDFTLPATASKMHYRTADESLRVRLGSGIGTSISVDFWFDLVEEVVRDDY